jgi:hypothetical protein
MTDTPSRLSVDQADQGDASRDGRSEPILKQLGWG